MEDKGLRIPDVKTVGILGAGLMGHGLALEFARAEYNVLMFDSIEDQRHSASSRLRASYETIANMGMAELGSAEETLDRIKVVDSIEDLGAASDYVLEAVTEDLDIKKAAFARLDEVCRPDTVLARLLTQQQP